MKKFRYLSQQLLENKKWRPVTKTFESSSSANAILEENICEQLFDTKEAANEFIRDYAKKLGFLEAEIEEMKLHQQ